MTFFLTKCRCSKLVFFPSFTMNSLQVWVVNSSFLFQLWWPDNHVQFWDSADLSSLAIPLGNSWLCVFLSVDPEIHLVILEEMLSFIPRVISEWEWHSPCDLESMIQMEPPSTSSGSSNSKPLAVALLCRGAFDPPTFAHFRMFGKTLH